ncbi:MAG: PepSY domain-containing protein [Burkholderiales bacterium]|nr:PepSY domain-containing protein [Burkholderiales bacterium]
MITPTVDSVGDIVHRWITWLHTARVFGLPMQILICLTGLSVAMLSVTGTVIWWRKRTSRQRPQAKLIS